MLKPQVLPTILKEETFAGFTYHLEGELVPALTIELQNNQSIYFERTTLLWKSSTVLISINNLAQAFQPGAFKSLFKRTVAGMQIIMLEATGQGPIAFSRSVAGQVFPVHLERGEEFHVRKGQFLAATHSLDYTYEVVKGASNILFGSSGIFIDRFYAAAMPGILWLHGYGNVVEVNLNAGEVIDVAQGNWVYKSPTVTMETIINDPATMLFGATSGFMLNRFVGPGRLGIQTLSANIVSNNKAPIQDRATTSGLIQLILPLWTLIVMGILLYFTSLYRH